MKAVKSIVFIINNHIPAMYENSDVYNSLVTVLLSLKYIFSLLSIKFISKSFLKNISFFFVDYDFISETSWFKVNFKRQRSIIIIERN